MGGTSLEAALAEIEEERARWANVPPPGVHGPAEIELKEVESDEAMARRLQSEEDAVRGTSRGPTQATPAYYPRVPYAQPVPFGPNTAHAPGEGRGFMDDFTPGFLYGLGAPPPAPTYNPQPIRNGPGDFARPVPFGAPSVPYGGVQVGVPVAAHLVPRGVIPPHLAQQPENDAALARRLQAEEDAGGSGFCMTGSQNNTQPPSSRNNTHQPPLNLTSDSDDASLAAAMQAEENALAQTERGARFNPYAANPADDADAALARRLQRRRRGRCGRRAEHFFRGPQCSEQIGLLWFLSRVRQARRVLRGARKDVVRAVAPTLLQMRRVPEPDFNRHAFHEGRRAVPHDVLRGTVPPAVHGVL